MRTLYGGSLVFHVHNAMQGIFKLTNFPLSSSQFRCGQGRKNDPRGKLIVQYHYIYHTFERTNYLHIYRSF